MSQAGILDVESSNPQIPTSFDTNFGIAIPILNNLEILGAVAPADSNPVFTTGVGKTVTVNVQISQEIAATDVTKIGLASFDSAGFDVDANGFVTLTGGGGAATNIDVDAFTPPGTDPVVPNAGNIIMTGAQVSTGVVGANVLRTNSLAANTVTYEIQQSGMSAAQNTTLNGVSHFNSAQFLVSNGYVSLVDGGIGIDIINGDSGSITGNTVTIYTNHAANQAGSSVKFTNSGTVSTFGVTDAGDNILIGRVAGNLTLTGLANTGLGAGVFTSLTTGSNGVALGYASQGAMTSGVQNCSIGRESLNQCQIGNGNCAFGFESLKLTTSATGSNSAFGWRSLNQLVGGSTNLALGMSTGTNYTGSESDNILMQNAGTLGESNTTRIGTQGSGTGQVNRCFVSGIVGVTVSNTQMVTIDSTTGQLGVSAASGIFAWTDITGASQTLAVGNGYATDNAGGVAYALPATAIFGQEIQIVGKLGLASIAQAAGQQIHLGNSSTTVGVTGSLTATNVGDCIHLRCITAGASTIWRAQDYVGNWTVV